MNGLSLHTSNSNYEGMSLFSFRSLIILFIIISILLYISQDTKEISTLYKISQLERQINKLSLENQKLELSLSSNPDGKEALPELAQKYNFKKINRIDYITIGETKVAER